LTLRIKTLGIEICGCGRTWRHGTTQTGQENGKRKQQKGIEMESLALSLSLFLYDMTDAMQLPRLRGILVNGVCGRHHHFLAPGLRFEANGGAIRLNPSFAVNHFLTLPVVTKW
jgi:hypothetical protein